jgi:hypothetical protein
MESWDFIIPAFHHSITFYFMISNLLYIMFLILLMASITLARSAKAEKRK